VIWYLSESTLEHYHVSMYVDNERGEACNIVLWCHSTRTADVGKVRMQHIHIYCQGKDLSKSQAGVSIVNIIECQKPE